MRRSRIVMILGLGLLLIACQKQESGHVAESGREVVAQEREEVNAVQGEHMASDGTMIYVIETNLIYRIDVENKEAQVNCGDLLCDHEGTDCSARLPASDYIYGALRRNGDHVYVLGDRIFEIGKNSKKEIGRGGYGSRGCEIIFDRYLAFFEKEDVIVVENLETGEEVQRFEGITGNIQGNFYYAGYLYYITAEWQLIRLNLETGEKEILEKKGATRASVYDGMIYYVRISEFTDTNHLVRMDPLTLEKEEVLEGVFYYNMLNDKLYYSTYPERQLWCSDLNGENPEVLEAGEEYSFGWIWSFPYTNKMLVNGNRENCRYYIMDENETISEKDVIMTLE